MSTPNFITQNDFPLMILDDTDYWFHTCPECGGWMERVRSGKWECSHCDYTTDDEDELEDEFDEIAYQLDMELVEHNLDRFNEKLDFFKVVLHNGYYRGVQTLVECRNDPHELDNDDCRYYWDICRSMAIRKCEVEQRKVAKFLKGLKDGLMKELVCVGIFSNGEAVYEYVK